jgi:SAM-dependent methyltransferase
MPVDAERLRDFYGSPLGDLARRLIGRIVRARWLEAAGMTVAGLGYGTPYLDRFRDSAERCLALMPAAQGAAVWPDSNRCAAALVSSAMLPLPDNSVDRLLIAHALEAAERPAELLEEVWRVVAPEGRILVVVPSRRGVWARADGTPFGHGLPYSKTQLRDLLLGAVFSPVFWGEALFAPPIERRAVIRFAPTIERMGAAFGLPFAGVLVVEAIKQVHRPVGVHALPRPRRATVTAPALAPSGAGPSALGRSCVDFSSGVGAGDGLEAISSSNVEY